MWLLRVKDEHNLSLVEHVCEINTRYAVLSYTWAADGKRVTFKTW